jgi:adenosylhomocysteine nucleosidase
MRLMRRSLSIVSLLLLLTAANLAQLGNTLQPAPVTRIAAVLSAMTIEIETLSQELTGKKEITVQGIRFTTGSLKESKVVLAHSGIGKVNAATTASLLIEHFQPSHILFTGIAGGLNPELRPGDVVIGAKTAYHDFGEWTPTGFRVSQTTDPFTGQLNPLFFPADAGLLEMANAAAPNLELTAVNTAAGERIPRVVMGVIVTGDAFIASPAKKDALRAEFKADATEMEGAAVAQVCWQRRVPCLILRSLSDGAGAKAPEDERLFEKRAAQNAARLVIGILGRLEAALSTPREGSGGPRAP